MKFSSLRFTARTVLISFAITADLFALWVWAVRPPLIYVEWLGLSPVPEDSPISRLSGWLDGEKAPGTPSGFIFLFEFEELVFTGTLLFALLVFFILLLTPRSRGWRGLLLTSPISVVRDISLRFRVRTALISVAILGFYLGWEIDAWRIWPLRQSYLQKAADAASQEARTRNQLHRIRELLIRSERSQPPDSSQFQQGYFRSKASLAAERDVSDVVMKRETGHLSLMISGYEELKHKYERAAANPRVAVTPDPPATEPTNVSLDWQGFDSRDYARALATSSEMARTYPDFVEAHERIAWISSSCPDARYRDGKRGVASATRACELTEWKDIGALMALAAADAEAGNFAEAGRWQEKVVEMTSHESNAAFFRDRLDLYKSGKPYRQR